MEHGNVARWRLAVTKYGWIAIIASGVLAWIVYPAIGSDTRKTILAAMMAISMVWLVWLVLVAVKGARRILRQRQANRT